MSKRKQFRKECRQELAQNNATKSNRLEPVPHTEWFSAKAPPGLVAVWRSRQFFVQCYRFKDQVRVTVNRTEIGKHRNFADGISWDDLQRIKREIGYGDRMAVEIYPEEYHVVNDANLRHLWILDRPLDFAWSNPAPSKEKSCLTCVHCRSWNYPGSLEEPPDSGWECSHSAHESRCEDFNTITDDRLYAVAIAASCPGYRYTLPEFDPY